MSLWTGYGVIVFPKGEDEPRCKMIPMSPHHITDLDTAAGIAQSIHKSGTVHGVIVDRWKDGRIVEAGVFKLPLDFNDKAEMTNKEYGLSLLPNDEARAAYLRGQELPPEGTPERREIDLLHEDQA